MARAIDRSEHLCAAITGAILSSTECTRLLTIFHSTCTREEQSAKPLRDLVVDILWLLCLRCVVQGSSELTAAEHESYAAFALSMLSVFAWTMVDAPALCLVDPTLISPAVWPASRLETAVTAALSTLRRPALVGPAAAAVAARIISCFLQAAVEGQLSQSSDSAVAARTIEALDKPIFCEGATALIHALRRHKRRCSVFPQSILSVYSAPSARSFAEHANPPHEARHTQALRLRHATFIAHLCPVHVSPMQR